MTSPLVKTGIIGSLVIAAIAGLTYERDPRYFTIQLQGHPQDSITKLSPSEGCTDQTTLRVAKSIEQHPEDWTQDHYTLSRGFGWFDGPPLRLWIANGADGLDFNPSTNPYQQDGMNYQFTPECRLYLYRVASSKTTIQERNSLERVVTKL